jgi:hypothetical protein
MSPQQFVVIVTTTGQARPWGGTRPVRGFRDVDLTTMTVTWVALAAVVIVGLLRACRMRQAKREPACEVGVSRAASLPLAPDLVDR